MQLSTREEEEAAWRWLRALCCEGRFQPALRAPPDPVDGVEVDKLRLGQQVATDNIFSLAYAELLSMLMMFAFEDQTSALVFTGESDTPGKAYFRYLSTMRRVRSWYEGDLTRRDSKARKNLRAVRAMHARVSRDMKHDDTRCSLHTLRPDPGQSEDVAAAARDAFAGNEGPIWATEDYSAPPAVNQRALAATQVGFVGLFILEPRRFGAHGVSERELDALVYLWWWLGRALGLSEEHNACAGGLGAARARCSLLVRACVLPRLARASPQWQHMADALCRGAAIAAPGNSLPFALSTLVDILGGPGSVEHLLSIRDRFWRWLYHLVLDGLMLQRPGREFHNALFRLSLWVSAQASRFSHARYALA